MLSESAYVKESTPRLDEEDSWIIPTQSPSIVGQEYMTRGGVLHTVTQLQNLRIIDSVLPRLKVFPRIKDRSITPLMPKFTAARCSSNP